MTVTELIEKLKELPGDLVVRLDAAPGDLGTGIPFLVDVKVESLSNLPKAEGSTTFVFLSATSEET